MADVNVTAEFSTEVFDPPIPNPVVLAWARSRRQLQLQTVAKHLGTPIEMVTAWENGNEVPSFARLRKLAKFYRRPLVEFFYSSLPILVEPEVIPDYRVYRGADLNRDRIPILEIQQWAVGKRLDALALFCQLDEVPPTISDDLRYALTENPDDAGAVVRRAIGPSVEEQLSLSNSLRRRFSDMIRDRLEQLGVLTLRSTELGTLGLRGMCLAEHTLPVVVFANELPSPRAFTLAHELAHVLTGHSGISGQRAPSTESHSVEKWCDRFAGAFLMPRDSVIAEWEQLSSTFGNDVSEHRVEVIASQFSVSRHAMTIRLVHLGIESEQRYWQLIKPKLDKEGIEPEEVVYGRGPHWGKYQNQVGNLFTDLVLTAWESSEISGHNAAELMDIKHARVYELESIRNRRRK